MAILALIVPALSEAQFTHVEQKVANLFYIFTMGQKSEKKKRLNTSQSLITLRGVDSYGLRSKNHLLMFHLSGLC